MQLKWGPGNRWTGQVELPLAEAADLKVRGGSGVGRGRSQRGVVDLSRGRRPNPNLPIFGALNLLLNPGPLSPSPQVVVLGCNSAGRDNWEPGANRHVDLPRLVAAGSPTGAADVHLTCAWGMGDVTPVRTLGRADQAWEGGDQDLWLLAGTAHL